MSTSKIALVTGGSRGLGRNMALSLAKKGIGVILTYHRQQALPLLADGGRVINISSGLTRFALPGSSAYAAMKGAIEVLTPYQAKELGARGIAVNTVAPGAIETDFGGGAVRDNAPLNAFVASQTALGRTGQPDDIGGVVAFLCTDEARWVNAQRLEASGGMFI